MSLKEELYAPFHSIQSRRGRGGNYDFITWKTVADRMNDVFGINWSSEIKSQEIVGENIIVRVRVTITNPDGGTLLYQEGYGGAKNDPQAEAGNPFKAAYSKAFKDACKKWGVGLNLEEDGETTDYVHSPLAPKIPEGFSGRELGLPSKAPNMPEVLKTLPTPPVMVEEEKPKFPIDTPPVIEKFPEFNDTVKDLKKVSVPGPSMIPPAGTKMKIKSDVVIKQELPSIPKTLAPSKSAMPMPPSIGLIKEDKPLSSKMPAINMGGPEYISDVQKAALHSILNIKDVEYESLAAEAFTANGVEFTTIPSPDNLTYQEAVYVVKYGNDKFRRR
jgi:hypothetical protein